MSNLTVIKAGQTIGKPEEFTGVIKRVAVVYSKDDNGGVKEEYIALTIEGLPNLVNEKGVKVSVLRTLKQAKNDLRYFSSADDNAEDTMMEIDTFAIGRNATFLATAHEKGAKLTVTPDSNYHVSRQGAFETGDLVELKDAGIYVEGFLDIDFAKADKIIKKNERKSMKATASESGLE